MQWKKLDKESLDLIARSGFDAVLCDSEEKNFPYDIIHLNTPIVPFTMENHWWTLNIEDDDFCDEDILEIYTHFLILERPL